MSARTIARRRKEAGLVVVPEPVTINEDLFASWSDELAWLVGLIWSDGCLFGNTIDISSKDLQLIDLVLSLAGGRYSLKNDGEHLRVLITSRGVAAFLRSIGLTERKSLTIAWPSELPAAYAGSFMRGLIDGDGSVIESASRPGQQVSDLMVQLVTASGALRDGVAEWFTHQGLRFSLRARTHERHNTLWVFVITHQDSLRTLYRLLYPSEDAPCLHRKRAPFDAWMATPRARPGRPKR